MLPRAYKILLNMDFRMVLALTLGFDDLQECFEAQSALTTQNNDKVTIFVMRIGIPFKENEIVMLFSPKALHSRLAALPQTHIVSNTR